MNLTETAKRALELAGKANSNAGPRERFNARIEIEEMLSDGALPQLAEGYLEAREQIDSDAKTYEMLRSGWIKERDEALAKLKVAREALLALTVSISDYARTTAREALSRIGGEP